MKNILVVNDLGISGGGTENRIRLLLQEFLRKKAFNSIHLLEHEASNSEMRGITVHKCNAKNSAQKTREIIQKHGIDLVQAHNLPKISTKPITTAKKLRKKIAWFAHDYWGVCAKRIMLRSTEAGAIDVCHEPAFLNCLQCAGIKTMLKLCLVKNSLNQADLAIAPSRFLARIYEAQGVLEGKWKKIVPWIDVARFKKARPRLEKNNILFVGPLLDYKGAFVAVKAMKQVLERMPGARLFLVGHHQKKGSAERECIESIAKELGIEKSIVFLGKKNWKQLVEEMENCSVFVCPTICQESFGLSWAEAMCAGLPVIASGIGSIPELSTEKAILAKPGDSTSFANAIIKILSNKKTAKRMSIEGKKFASTTFTVERAAKELLEMYNSIASFQS